MKCFNCGTEIILDRKVFRQDVCPQCDSYLHCCLNCRFYDPLASHECRESEAKWARDKEAANFCDYFEPGEVTGKRITSKQDDARKKLDELFKKGNK
ncbi:hypothetical protein JXQ31_18810 [candidate division KSB1 bacterium]|nr:hypothetical protein [candidate division KSB1 bacterium]